jgi:hypothetical protein
VIHIIQNVMNTRIFFRVSVVTFIFSLLTVFINDLTAQPAKADSIKKSFRLFKDNDLIEISLRFDLSTYFRAKPQDEYLKANLTFHLSKTDTISRDIRLRTRGVFRNKFCMYAPIELNLKRAKFGYTDLNRISKLKMVPQCSAGRDKEDYVLREYLIYKLFNVLTDTSFRVRLLVVNYIDDQGKKKPVRQYGFFIEPLEMLAARTNCLVVKSALLTQKSIIPKIMDRLAIFNFMIGNYDWSVPGLHNVAVIKSKNFDPTGAGLGISIPHDFDWSGFVNPTYAVPTEETGLENVRERKFLGVCRDNEVYNKELDLFLDKKQEFYRIIEEFPYFDKYVKRDLTHYLDGFFDQLAGKRERILYNFTTTCKKI